MIGLTVLATACGAGSTSSAPASLPAGGRASVDFLKRAAFTTVVQSCQVTVTVHHVTSATTIQTATGAGVIDFHGHRGQLDLVIDGAGPVRFILDGEYAYLNFERLRLLLGGRPWFKSTYSQLGHLGPGYGMGAVSSSAATDPTQGVGLIAGATGPVTIVGTRTIRGEATTEYHVNVDPRALKGVATGALARAVGLIEDTTFPIDLWIDGAGRVRLVRYTIQTAATPDQPTGARQPVDAEVEYFGFGSPVTTSAPPPSEVRDISGLTAYLGSTATNAP